MGRYGTREDEVDQLLRSGTLVDLYRVVRQSLRASVESYSIKKLEPFYGFAREIDLRDAGSSIVAFEEWLQLGEGDQPTSDILERIERYNRDDVVSTRRLRDWLEARRVDLATATGLDVPRPAPREARRARGRVGDAGSAWPLSSSASPRPTIVPTDPAERSETQHGQWLLAQLLGWHRREDKAMWWEFHRLMDLSPEQLVDEADPIGLLEPIGPIDEVTKSGKQTWRYRFPPQDFDVGRDVYDPALKQERPDDSPFSWGVGTVVATDPAANTVDLQRIAERAAPARDRAAAVDPAPSAHQERLIELGEWVADHGIDADGPYRAARDLVLGRPPRVGRRARRGARRTPTSRDLAAARRLVGTLDRTTLPIQGPPGAGKTYSGARMICTLLRRGPTRRHHRRRATRSSATSSTRRAQGGRGGGHRGPAHPARQRRAGPRRRARPAERRTRRTCAPQLDDGRANLAAGTSWLWASSKLVGAIDVLFVDEAGQISLANVLAMSQAPDSLVLLGDPQQLDQPLQGIAPARRGALGAGPRPARPGDDPVRSRPVPRDDLAAAPDALRVHLGGLLRRPARGRGAPRRPAALDP